MRQILLNSSGAVVARVPRPLVERGVEYASLAKHYFRASLRDPKKAMDRVSKILRTQASKLKPARPVPIVPAVSGELTWTPRG